MIKKKKFWQAVAAAFLACGLFFTVGSISSKADSINNSQPGKKASVSFDHYSLKINGRRTPIYSGEFHYWRIPNQSLWSDVFQKMKASGYNTVQIYFDWGYHSPKPGVYDFSGPKNVDKVLDAAQKAGLYVIARPGPYINAETDSGGFPGWLTRHKGVARTADPNYTKDYMQWLSQIDPIIKRHQITSGGNVVLYQIENEYTGSDKTYMQDVINKAKKDGISVPLFHNDVMDSGSWASGKGAPDMYGYDHYSNLDQLPTNFDDPHTKDWGRHSPLFSPELGTGWFDDWNGMGYNNVRKQYNANYENVLFKQFIGQGFNMLSLYMTYGGTNWGNLFEPTVYSSYDYSAPINEKRQITAKASQQKKIGYMLQSVSPIAKTNKVSNAVLPNAPGIHLFKLENPDTKTQFYTLRHDVANSKANTTFNLPIKGQRLNTKVPVTLNGQTSKILLANYKFGKQNLLYSTSEMFTNFTNGSNDYAVMYNRKGDKNQTVLKYNAKPQVKVNSGEVSSKWNNKNKTLTLKNNYHGLANLQIKAQGQSLNLILGTDQQMNSLWLNNTNSGKVLTQGPYLVRSAKTTGNTLALTGDTKKATKLNILAPNNIRRVLWNGKTISTSQNQTGIHGQLPGVNKNKVKLPKLKHWKAHSASPETKLAFNDKSWQKANKNKTYSLTQPKTKPVLFSDDYGFHYGDTWYRGHFKAKGSESGIKLNGITGIYGAYSVWLNGKFLGSANINPDQNANSTVGQSQESKTHTFKFNKADLKKNHKNVVSILVANMGHDESGPENLNKIARGLTEAKLQGKRAHQDKITWKLQGNKGGENIADKTRGSYNLGGLYGERKGWYLPGFKDKNWKSVTLPNKQNKAGVNWYRTKFNLNLPKNYDVPISLKFNSKSKAAKYRANIYINGWNYGQYINNLGPQKEFYLPAGLLNPKGHNTLAIGVWGLDKKGDSLGKVSLKTNGTYNSALRTNQVSAPNYQDLYHK